MKSKNFLFISKESLSGDLAAHVAEEGHSVKVYVRSRNDRDVYNGILDKVKSWKSYVDWADVIVFDDTGFGEVADKLRKARKLVVGGSKYTDRLEEDRMFGQEQLKKYGVKVLENVEFSDYDAAIKYLRKKSQKYVFKPTGYISSEGKDLLFIGQNTDGSDLVEFLVKNKVYLKKNIRRFILQQYVSGIEVAAGAFFNGWEFIFPINVNFEHKKLFPGDIGPMTGEMGTLMFWSRSNIIFSKVLEPFLEPLRKARYVGYIDVNCIVNKRGIYPLEFTARFGYPTIHIQLEGILMPAGEWLYCLAKGDSFELTVKPGFQVGAVLMIPSYFSGNDDPRVVNIYKNLSISFRQNNMQGIHLGDVKKDKKGIWRVAGTSGWVFVAAASGLSVERARRTLYKRICNIQLLNMFYRTDIGTRWRKDALKLRSWKQI